MKKRDRPWKCQRGSKTRRVPGYFVLAKGSPSLELRFGTGVLGQPGKQTHRDTLSSPLSSCNPPPVNFYFAKHRACPRTRLGQRARACVRTCVCLCVCVGRLQGCEREGRGGGRGREECEDRPRCTRVGHLGRKGSVFLLFIPDPPTKINK